MSMKLTSTQKLLPTLLAAAIAAPTLAQPLVQNLNAPAPAPAKPAAAPKKGPAVKAATPVTLNFVNADIEAVTRAIGVMMGRQFIIDPRVKGTITVYSEIGRAHV